MPYYPGYKGRRTPSERDRNIRAGLAIGTAAAAYLYFSNKPVGVASGSTYGLEEVNLTYLPWDATSGPISTSVAMNEVINARPSDITLRLSAAGNEDSGYIYVRVLIDTYRVDDGFRATIRQRERVYKVYAGNYMSHTFQPHELDMLPSYGIVANEAHFTLIVMPPDSGGAPKEGVTYPSYSFVYKVGA